MKKKIIKKSRIGNIFIDFLFIQKYPYFSVKKVLRAIRFIKTPVGLICFFVYIEVSIATICRMDHLQKGPCKQKGYMKDFGYPV